MGLMAYGLLDYLYAFEHIYISTILYVNISYSIQDCLFVD